MQLKEANRDPVNYPMTLEAIWWNQYWKWTEDAYRGQGVLYGGIGYGERSPTGSEKAYFSDPPWSVPPPQSIELLEENVGVLPALGAAVTILSFEIEEGRDASFHQFGLANIEPGTTYENGSGDLTWTLFIDLRGVDGFTNQILEQGDGAQPRDLRPGALGTVGGVQVSVQVINVGAPVGDRIKASLTGYTYPSQPR